jgi:hypothetical protein
MVLELTPRLASEPALVMKLQVRLQNGIVRRLELVRQTVSMKVYVNPDPLGYDEWEIPSGGGEVYYVMTNSSPSRDGEVFYLMTDPSGPQNE